MTTKLKHLTTVRSYLPSATIGYVDLPNKRLQSLERPWLDNKASVSCIPEGTYLVRRDRTGKHQYYAITNVPERTFIEQHTANYVSQLEGCQAIGLTRMDDNISIGSSELAMKDLMEYIGSDEEYLMTFRAFNPAFDSVNS